jgi:hypothetical protein
MHSEFSETANVPFPKILHHGELRTAGRPSAHVVSAGLVFRPEQAICPCPIFRNQIFSIAVMNKLSWTAFPA